jgi:hypothetical protein
MIILRHKKNPVDDVIALLDRIANLDTSSTAKIAGAVREGHAENFTKQRAGDGAAWAPLAPATQRDRARKGFAPARPILIRRDDYMHSFTEAGNPDHVEVVEKTATGLSIFVGSRDFRTGALEEGSGTMPAREVLPLSAGARAKVGNTIESIIDLLVKHG